MTEPRVICASASTASLTVGGGGVTPGARSLGGSGHNRLAVSAVSPTVGIVRRPVVVETPAADAE